MTGAPVARQLAGLRIAAAAAVVVIAACGRSSTEPDRLPAALGEWSATGEAAEFAGDDLFIYIDGGAEIYHEYGFERLAVREYGRGDERVAVELYTMAGSAYGIYSYARSASGQPVRLGAGGTLADYYLHFWSGPHLVAVTARDLGADAQAAVLDLATLLAGDFADVGDVPRLMDELPTGRCTPGSQRYAIGSLGLSNAAPPAAPLFRGFDEAAVARCRSASGEEALLVVLRWTDAASAVQAVTEAFARAASTEGIDGEPVGETGFQFRVGGDEFIGGARTGELVRLAVARGDEPRLDGLFPIDNLEANHE